MLLLFAFGGGCWLHGFEVDDDLVDLAGELEGDVVAEIDRGAGVFAYVEALVEGVADGDGALDASLCELLAVGGEGEGAALAHAAAVIFEVGDEVVLARGEDLRGGDVVLVAIDGVVVEDGLALFEVEGPAAEESALRDDDPFRPGFVGDRNVGRDGEGAVLGLGRGAFGDAGVAVVVGEGGAACEEAGTDAGAVEVLESETRGPEIEWAGFAGLPVGNVVVFAEPRGVPAFLTEHFREAGGVFADEGVVPGIACAAFHDDAGVDGVMVAPHQQRGAGRRAESGGVEVGVFEAVLGEALKRGHVDGASEGAGGTVSHVVEENQKDVGRTFGGLRPAWESRVWSPCS